MADDIAVILLLTRDGVDVTGEIVGDRIPNAAAGDYVATWTASNGVLPNASRSTSLTVDEPPVSAPSIIGAIADRTYTVGQTVPPTDLRTKFDGATDYLISPSIGGASIDGHNLIFDASSPVEETTFTVWGVNGAGQSGPISFKLIISIAAEAPAVQTVPAIAGSTTVGSILTRTAGTATGVPTPTRATVWLRNGTEEANIITGQTGNTLDTSGFAADDVIYTRDVWTNSQGSATGTSEPWTLTVQPALTATVTPNPLVAGQPGTVTFNTAPDSVTGNVTFTGTGTTRTFTAPEDASVNVTIGAVRVGYSNYSRTLDVEPDPNAYDVVRRADYTLGINTLMTRGEAAFVVSEHERDIFVDTFAVDRTILEAGPYCHVDPEIDDTVIPAPGQPLVGRPGLWEITPRTSGSEYDEVLTRLLNGAPQADLIAGFGSNVLEQAITDAKGTRKALTAPVVFTAPTTMTRNSVLFGGTAKLQHGTSLGSSATSFLLFAQFTKRGAATRQQLFNIGGVTRAPVQLWDADAVRSAWETDPTGSLIVGATQLGAAVANQRVTMLVNGHVTANGLAIETAHLRNDALSWLSVLQAVTDRASFKMSGTVPGFSIGSEHLAGTGFNQPWQGSLHRLAFWANTEKVEVSSAAVRNLFVAAGTDDLMQVDASYDAFGLPLMDLYGPAADYNARKLNGLIGTADTLVGTFTNG